ncbi:MAG TPA: hypothetical protein VMZ53_06450 [Kofleriaceae bacterium]|nr:hypothetical protein [Kofleriaceae bacterium]
MLVAVLARVLAQIILVLCFAAGMAASCIIFVLYGPVPVRRKVTIVPRLSPPDVFAIRAVKVVSLPAPVEAVQQIEPGIAFRTPPAPPQAPARAKKSEPRPGTPDVAPLVLRRPRGDSPAPLPRSRSARGTERRPRPSELDITSVRSLESNRSFETSDNTLETPLVELGDDQFLEDGR